MAKWEINHADLRIPMCGLWRPGSGGGGLDDHTALCAPCGGLMLHLDEDIFQPYFEEMAEPAWPETKAKVSL